MKVKSLPEKGIEKMKIKKINLFLLAAIVWSIAGFNVLRIGLVTYPPYITIINIILSIVVFMLFQTFVFGKLVKKHTKRIFAYEEEKQYFWNFFDLKSFIIMAFMISFGVIIRKFNLMPDRFIAVFYTGLGASLFLAGISFGIVYFRNIFKEDIWRLFMKRYMNYSIIYTVLALVFGVFYREFTKFNGFSGSTSLSIIHTHYLMLGMFVFLVLVIFDKQFEVSKYISKKLEIFYNVGLNLTCALMLVRGVVEVMGVESSKALNASISGMAGIGHIILGISLVMFLLKLKKAVLNTK